MDSEIKNNDHNRLSVSDCLEILKDSTIHKNPDFIPLEALKELDNRLKNNQELKKLAEEAGAFDILVQVLATFDIGTMVTPMRYALRTIIRLMGDQRNWQLNDRGIGCQIGLLKKFEELMMEEGEKEKLRNFSHCLRLLIRWIKICSIKNETNRRSIFNAGFTNSMQIILKSEKINAPEFCDLCSLFRALVLDDDPNFECGNGFFRARRIADEILPVVAASLRKFKNDEKTACEIFKTMIALLVRNQFSKIIHRSGGVESILDTIKLFDDDEEICCLGFKLIKILANDREAKARLMESGVAPLVLSALLKIQTGSIAVLGLGCVAALTLQSPKNAELFYDLEAARLTVETMKSYPGSSKVQREGARVVSRISEARSCCEKIDAGTFLDLELEALLEIAMRLHDEAGIEDDLRAALHHLGLESELKDRWTKTPTEFRVVRIN